MLRRDFSRLSRTTPEVAVVLDAHARRLDALGQVAGQAVGDLLVQAPLEAVLGAVAEHAQRVVGDRRAVLQVARVVGLRQVERLAPGAPGQRAQQLGVLGARAPRRRRGTSASRRRRHRRTRCAPPRTTPSTRCSMHARAEGPRDLDRGVGRARVDDHDLIDRRRQPPPGSAGASPARRARSCTGSAAGPRRAARARRSPAARRESSGSAARSGARASQSCARGRPARGELLEVALHVLELRVQALGGLEHRLARVAGSRARAGRPPA